MSGCDRMESATGVSASVLLFGLELVVACGAPLGLRSVDTASGASAALTSAMVD
jgi:hypothetical protein